TPDPHGATPWAGLSAAGEAACVSINGATRLGSNSLPELLVFGARAGRAAADFASIQQVPRSIMMAQAEDEKRRLENELLRKECGSERLAALREDMQNTMEQSAGIYRSGDSLARAADTLRGPHAPFP